MGNRAPTPKAFATSITYPRDGTPYRYTRYKSYGEARGGCQCGPDGNCREFTGYITEPISGLGYAVARMYGPALGMFLTQDPIRKYPNLYAYVAWDPVNQTDPTGTDPTPSDDLKQYGKSWFAGPDLSVMDFSGYESRKSVDAPGVQHVLAGDAPTPGAGQEQLTPVSRQAIKKTAKKYGYKAAEFETTTVKAGEAHGLDPNLLVGLGFIESSLNPGKEHGGLFQIQPAKAKELGISDKDLGKFQVQIPKTAEALSQAITKLGNVDLGLASWALGMHGAQALFSSGGMEAVRNALLYADHPELGRVGPDYIDVIKEYLP